MLKTLSNTKISSKFFLALRVQDNEAIIANISVEFNETFLEVPFLNVYEVKSAITGRSLLTRRQKIVCSTDRLFRSRISNST